MSSRKAPPLRTPDGRYLVVRGRLWRASNPALDAGERERLTRGLMDARRAWWTDGAPDWNRSTIARTPYADWYEKLRPHERDA